jgi:thioredoxin 1
MATVKVTDDSFEADVIGADKPVLVDFWAEYCGPCIQMAPALEEVSDELADKITIAKVNIADEPEYAAKYHIRSIPTLMIFKDGEVIATRPGAMSKSKLADWIGEHT